MQKSPDFDEDGLSEYEFVELVQEALPRILGAFSLEREPKLSGGGRPDFLAWLLSKRAAIIEVKVVTPATAIRLDKIAAQLLSYATAFEHTFKADPELVLVVSGSLSPDQQTRLRRAGIDRVIDGAELRAAAPSLPWPDSVGGAMRKPRPTEPRKRLSLIDQLDVTLPGRADWAKYQRVVRDILAETLVPPLAQPLDEHGNRTGVNRRDVIFPNYAVDGPWKFLRDHYEAHYVVVDAKNYVGPVKKKEILQIANYLSSHGAGLFGMIVCRNAADRSAEVTRQEQWMIYRKMIIVLNDEDLRTMLTISAEGDDAGVVIRQKIEDFRLGF